MLSYRNLWEFMCNRLGGNDTEGREASAHIETEKSLRRTRSDNKDDKVKSSPEEIVKDAKCIERYTLKDWHGHSGQKIYLV